MFSWILGVTNIHQITGRSKAIKK